MKCYKTIDIFTLGIDSGSTYTKGAIFNKEIEVIMRLLEEDMCNIDNFVKNKNKVTISSMCTDFAES